MRSPFLLVLLLAAACGGARINPPDYPDHIIGADPGGSPIRERGKDDRVRVTFPAPVDRVFDAVAGAYLEAGILPSVNDRAEHRYGNVGFLMPNDFGGAHVSEYFDCGSDITGRLAGKGRLIAVAVTSLRAIDSGSTLAATQVTGTVRRMDGTSTMPANCVSTGKLEAQLRKGVEARLSK
jgi:hypothetical protein